MLIVIYDYPYHFILFIASEISECSEGTSDEEAMDEIDTSYSADVSQASDLEEADKTLNKQESDHKDPRESMYIITPPARRVAEF